MTDPLLKKRIKEASRTEPENMARLARQGEPGLTRLWLKSTELLGPVIGEIELRLEEDGCALVALDGPCGSGKTTLANVLGDLYDLQPIAMDDFFLPSAMRTRERLDQAGGNVHYERFLDEVIRPLVDGGDIAYRRFDCHSGAFCPRVHRRAPLTVIEGSYAHHPAFWTAYERLRALRVFVWTDAEEQLRRLRMRTSECLESFQSLWIPLEKKYFEAYDIQGRADIVLQSHPWEAEEERE